MTTTQRGGAIRAIGLVGAVVALLAACSPMDPITLNVTNPHGYAVEITASEALGQDGTVSGSGTAAANTTTVITLTVAPELPIAGPASYSVLVSWAGTYLEGSNFYDMTPGNSFDITLPESNSAAVEVTNSGSTAATFYGRLNTSGSLTITNYQDYALGTVPANGTATFRVLTFSTVGTQLNFAWRYEGSNSVTFSTTTVTNSQTTTRTISP